MKQTLETKKGDKMDKTTNVEMHIFTTCKDANLDKLMDKFEDFQNNLEREGFEIGSLWDEGGDIIFGGSIEKYAPLMARVARSYDA